MNFNYRLKRKGKTQQDTNVKNNYFLKLKYAVIIYNLSLLLKNVKNLNQFNL